MMGEYTCKHTDQWDYEAAVEMGSGAMIYIPSFFKTDSGIQKLVGGYKDKQKG
jgi:hypothetical protein